VVTGDLEQADDARGELHGLLVGVFPWGLEPDVAHLEVPGEDVVVVPVLVGRVAGRAVEDVGDRAGARRARWPSRLRGIRDRIVEDEPQK
jgi:hypothetical protein